MKRKNGFIIGIVLLAVVSTGYISWYLLSGRDKEIVVPESEEREEREKFPQHLYASLGIQRINPPYQAKNFTLEDLSGSTVSLREFQNKVVFLNFWATWCGPCRVEMPGMELLWQMFQDDDFVILAVDVREGRNTVKSFIEENGYTFPVLLDTRGRAADFYDVRAYPTTFLINTQGNVVGKAVGARQWASEDTFDLIKYLLAKKMDIK